MHSFHYFRLKTNSCESVHLVKAFLDEIDQLIQETISMIQGCSQTVNQQLNDESQSFSISSLPLSQSLSHHLFGTNQASIYVKNIQDFPEVYKEKFSKPLEIKPLDVVKTEIKTDALSFNNKSANHETDLINEIDGDVLDELHINDEDFKDDTDDNYLQDNDENHQDDPQDDQDPDPENDAVDDENKSEKKENAKVIKKRNNSSIKKKEPNTCEKCHKTYSTQTQFKIHQRVGSCSFPFRLFCCLAQYYTVRNTSMNPKYSNM